MGKKEFSAARQYLGKTQMGQVSGVSLKAIQSFLEDERDKQTKYPFTSFSK